MFLWEVFKELLASKILSGASYNYLENMMENILSYNNNKNYKMSRNGKTFEKKV